MEPAHFFRASRIIIVAGKGGVGKTTVTSALGRAAADHGIRTLIAELQDQAALAAPYGHDEVGYEEIMLCEADVESGRAELHTRVLDPHDITIEYLRERHVWPAARTLARRPQLLEGASAWAPSLRDLMVLGKTKQLAAGGDYGLVVIDAPAAGHALAFLRATRALLETVKGGEIRRQAIEVEAMLTDPERCQVILVTLAEETPVNELIETAYLLEDEIGVKLGPIVVNAVLPELAGLDGDVTALAAEAELGLSAAETESLRRAAAFRLARQRSQAAQMERLENELPLPQIRLPRLHTEELDAADVAVLAQALTKAIVALDETRLGQ
jgi:anion-transporting  ArsA/GET3 family ATPase